MGENNHYLDPSLHMKIVNLIHVFLIAPLFIYIGIKKQNTPNSIFKTLFYLGIIVAIYHLYRMISTYLNVGVIPYLYVNLIHVALVAPILIYIGYHNTKNPILSYHILLIFAITMIFSNGYKLLSR